MSGGVQEQCDACCSHVVSVSHEGAEMKGEEGEGGCGRNSSVVCVF